MRCTVLLQHDLPGGSSHLDWLIQTSEDPSARILAFRLSEHCRPDLPRSLLFAAERIADHRPLYLTHQGPVSGNRGHLTRLAQGNIIDLIAGPDTLDLRTRFNDSPHHFLARRTANSIWLFERR